MEGPPSPLKLVHVVVPKPATTALDRSILPPSTACIRYQSLVRIYSSYFAYLILCTRVCPDDGQLLGLYVEQCLSRSRTTMLVCSHAAA